VQPINAAPPNLRDEMCGSHRKRPATEDEDDTSVTVDSSPQSPYGVLLAALRPKTKGGALFQDGQLGEPVLVYTGTKPPAPGAPDPSQKSRSDKKKSIAGKPAAKDAPSAGATSSTPSSDAIPAKPRPKKPAAKPVPPTPASTQQTSQIR
jgi:D-alanyl-D-alanine carboxypeptidase